MKRKVAGILCSLMAASCILAGCGNGSKGQPGAVEDGTGQAGVEGQNRGTGGKGGQGKETGSKEDGPAKPGEGQGEEKNNEENGGERQNGEVESGAGQDKGTGSGSGQGGEAAGSQKDPAGGTRKIGISMPSESDERWERDGAYMQKQLNAAGFEAGLAYSGEATQQSAIQKMIADGAELLIVMPKAGDGLQTVMEQAAKANIPVIAYDRFIKSSAVACYVSLDYGKAGKLQGEFLASQLALEQAGGEAYQIELTAGSHGEETAVSFYQGLMDVLQPYLDTGALNILSGQSDFASAASDSQEVDAASQRAKNLLGAYYADGTQLDAWLCANGPSALGVAQALASDYKGGNQVLLAGIGGGEANLKNTADGVQAMDIDTSSEPMVTVELAKAILNGSKLNSSLIYSFQTSCTWDADSYKDPQGKDLQGLAETGMYEMGGDGYLHVVK